MVLVLQGIVSDKIKSFEKEAFELVAMETAFLTTTMKQIPKLQRQPTTLNSQRPSRNRLLGGAELSSHTRQCNNNEINENLKEALSLRKNISSPVQLMHVETA